MHALLKPIVMLLILAVLLTGAIYGGLMRMISETWSGQHPAVRLRSFLLGAADGLTAALLFSALGVGIFALCLWIFGLI